MENGSQLVSLAQEIEHLISDQENRLLVGDRNRAPRQATMMVDKDVPQLTTGFCDKIASSTGPQDPIFKTSPILQIFQAKCIGIGDQKRWRVLISDGTKCLQAIVATRLNNLFERCLVKNGSIVRVGGLGENIINGRR